MHLKLLLPRKTGQRKEKKKIWKNRFCTNDKHEDDFWPPAARQTGGGRRGAGEDRVGRGGKEA